MGPREGRPGEGETDSEGDPASGRVVPTGRADEVAPDGAMGPPLDAGSAGSVGAFEAEAEAESEIAGPPTRTPPPPGSEGR